MTSTNTINTTNANATTTINNSFITPDVVEPSESTKSSYRDLQAKGEEKWNDIKIMKLEARRVLKETRNSKSAVEPFPLEMDDDDSGSATSTAAASGRPSVDQNHLLEEMQSMIHLSSLIYAFAAVRKTIGEGGIRQSYWPWSKNHRKQLDHYEIILDNDTKLKLNHDDHDHNSNTTKSNACGCLKEPLDGAKLERVLTPANMEHLSNDAELANELNVEAILAMKEMGPDGLLWEFDDQFGGRPLVYAITVNKVAKRVTIIFRGSTVTQDWLTNFTIGPKELDLPECLQDGTDLGGVDLKEDPIAVHSGFYNYLDKSFDHVAGNLKDIYEKHPGYELFVTGHSLGGALASLLSYHLAGSTTLQTDVPTLPLPVTCISYASPLVGNKSFQATFQAMERLGRLRHIRLTNQYDMVPLSPPYAGYVQTGVNLHLIGSGGRYKISYAKTSQQDSLPFWSQFRFGSVAAHSLVQYWQRGHAAEENYLEKLREGKFDGLYISDLYDRIILGASGGSK